jgi:microcompartment protein CcmL/EutN
MGKRSLGLIESWGYVPAIEAADAGSKAANVTLLGYERARGGLVTVKFLGDVAAVKASVSAGVAAAKRVGKVVAVHVIPRPDRQIPIIPDDRHPPQEGKKSGKGLETPRDVKGKEAKTPPKSKARPKAKKVRKAAASRSDTKGRKTKVKLPRPKRRAKKP